MSFKKYKIGIIIGIFTMIIAVLISLFVINSFKKSSIITEIKKSISDGEYDKTIELYDNNVERNLEIKKQFEEDIKIIKEYISLKEKDFSKDKITSLTSLLEKYKDTLEKDYCKTLKDSIGYLVNNLKDSFTVIDEKTKAFDEALHTDINKAQEILKSLKDQFRGYNFEELDKKIEEHQKVEAEKAEAEKRTEAEKKVGEDEKLNSGSNNSSGGSLLPIGSTVAAKNSSQLITVVSLGGSTAELAIWEKESDGNWKLINKVPAHIGVNGMKDASLVYEMDKCTPTGNYSLTESFGVNKNPGTAMPFRQLDGSEYWVDDVNSKYYNTMQFGEAKDRWVSAEHLISFDKAYRYSVVIDYNRWPVVPGKSSAIFLHVDEGFGTYGCVAIPENEMVNILNWLNPSKNPRILLDFSYDNIYSKY